MESFIIDLRSDTVTRPSPAMRKAMADAEVGDDVSREDPTILRLEGTAAELMGKEAALFVPSGTFGNQLALFTQAQRGSELYCSDQSHIIQHEAGASAYISGVLTRTIQPRNHWLCWEDLAPVIRSVRDQHFPLPGVIALENALSSGRVQPLEAMKEITANAKKLKVPLHLDGARIFNASLALGCAPLDIAAQADTVMFCLSKGLGAPAGSLLCGSRDIIDEARFKRKIMGGGMRQIGILGAAGLVALEEWQDVLPRDHQRARALAETIAALPAFHSDPQAAEINMVFMKLKGKNSLEDQNRFHLQLKEKGLLTYPPEQGEFRFVFHRDITEEDFRQTLMIFQALAEEMDE